MFHIYRVKVLIEWTQFCNMSLGFIFEIFMQNFSAIRSTILEKITFEVAIFGNFPDIPKRKLSRPPEHLIGWMWRWVEVSLADLPFLYFLWAVNQTRDAVLYRPCSSVHLSNHNKINSDDTLPFIIFFKTPFLRWLESPLASTLVATIHVPYEVIKRYLTSFGR